MRNTGGDSSDESSDSSPEQNLEADTWIRNLRGEDVAQQLSDLHLGRGAIRRTSMGGSMRMPVQPSLRDNNISGARHSTDQSYEASSRSRSGLSTSSQEEPITRQPKKKGFFAAVKHKVKKAFAQRSGEKPSKDWTREPETVVETTFRVDQARKPTPAPAEDANLIDAAAAAARRFGYSESSIRENHICLRGLSRELNSRGGLAQLDDEQLREYVDAEYPRDKVLRRNKSCRAALNMLAKYRKAGNGGPQPVNKGKRAAKVAASLEDDGLINEARAAAVANGMYAQTTADFYRFSLCRLSQELRSYNQTITRLKDAELQRFVAEQRLTSYHMQGALRMLESHREAQRTQNSQDVGGSFQPFEWQLVVP
ncbi:hypothetical protein BS630_27150, partial [Rhizobium laguerreae]|uniref:hypothetical protein n=1 Tax=Rhizobium laguerreae TaxID=1076926 RepID=UPI0009CB63F2